MAAEAWGCCASPRWPGELLTRGDVCHADRAAAERCGVLLGGASERRGRCQALRADGYVAGTKRSSPPALDERRAILSPSPITDAYARHQRIAAGSGRPR